MITLNGLEHIGIEVPDLELVRRFYQNVFGFTVAMERELPPGGRVRKLLFLQGPGVKLEFLHCPEVQVPHSFHISFQVPSISRTVEALKAAGLEQADPVRESGTGPDGVRRFRTVFLGPVSERLEFQGPE